jgi:hemolysin activation/secretion protein
MKKQIKTVRQEKMKAPKFVEIVFMLVLINIFILLGNVTVYAQNVGAQDASAQETKKEIEVLNKKVNQLEKTVASQAELIAQQKQILEKIGEAIPSVKALLAPPEPKVLVKAFVLDGVNLFSPKDFEPILKKYRNKKLGMSDLKKICDEISVFYRKKGYVSSMAYLPPQGLANNTVNIKVVEGRVGKIRTEKPKYSRASGIKDRFFVKEGEILDSKKMENSLEDINNNQDRVVRAVLSPGTTSETSDILLKIDKERSPYHFYTDFNDRGTNTTDRLRWGLKFVDTNLLGWDDPLSLQFLASQRTSDVYSFSADYNLPVNSYGTRVGIYGAYAKADIGGQFAIISPQGRADLWGIYASHPLFKKEFMDDETSSSLKLASNLTGGFDWASVHNNILGDETSDDETRVIKGGINFNEKDNMGRSSLNTEVHIGLANFMGSMGEHDVKASRIDAGGRFQTYLATFNRTTYLPLNSYFLNTFRLQYSQDPLVSSQQMVLGGADSVRGFPENNYLADYGWILNTELRTPAFLIPSMFKVPFDKKHTRLIDAIQFVAFIDTGSGYLNEARVGEEAHQFLVGAGYGLRFDLYEHLTGMIDIGYPTGGSDKPADNAPYQVHWGLEYKW